MSLDGLEFHGNLEKKEFAFEIFERKVVKLKNSKIPSDKEWILIRLKFFASDFTIKIPTSLNREPGDGDCEEIYNFIDGCSSCQIVAS